MARRISIEIVASLALTKLDIVEKCLTSKDCGFLMLQIRVCGCFCFLTSFFVDGVGVKKIVYILVSLFNQIIVVFNYPLISSFRPLLIIIIRTIFT